MRLLVDNPVSPQILPPLAAAGHDIVHMRDLGLASAVDRIILDLARQEDRVVITQDTDFGALLAANHAVKPSVVLLPSTARCAPSQPCRSALGQPPHRRIGITSWRHCGNYRERICALVPAHCLTFIGSGLIVAELSRNPRRCSASNSFNFAACRWSACWNTSCSISPSARPPLIVGDDAERFDPAQVELALLAQETAIQAHRLLGPPRAQDLGRSRHPQRDRIACVPAHFHVRLHLAHQVEQARQQAPVPVHLACPGKPLLAQVPALAVDLPRHHVFRLGLQPLQVLLERRGRFRQGTCRNAGVSISLEPMDQDGDLLPGPLAIGDLDALLVAVDVEAVRLVERANAEPLASGRLP